MLYDSRIFSFKSLLTSWTVNIFFTLFVLFIV